MKIVQTPNPVLSQKAKKVDKIGSEEKKIIKNMKKVLSKTDEALALAAPQVGISKQITVIKEYKNKEKGISIPEMVLINPKIISKSSEKVKREEGCLSVAKPEIRGEVSRAKKVKIEYLDKKGKKRTKEAQGLLARIFQHEIDHLKGKIFLDKANPTTLYQSHEEK